MERLQVAQLPGDAPAAFWLPTADGSEGNGLQIRRDREVDRAPVIVLVHWPGLIPTTETRGDPYLFGAIPVGRGD